MGNNRKMYLFLITKLIYLNSKYNKIINNSNRRIKTKLPKIQLSKNTTKLLSKLSIKTLKFAKL